MLIYNLFTPRYSWNTAKVCVKHQSINPLNIKEIFIDLSTLLYKMVYNRNHKEKPNFVDGQLIIQTSQIQRICITVDRYLLNSDQLLSSLTVYISTCLVVNNQGEQCIKLLQKLERYLSTVSRSVCLRIVLPYTFCLCVSVLFFFVLCCSSF
jgi:hypothetical protein